MRLGHATFFRLRNEVVINRGKSVDVLEGFDDAYFDWVYIDGNHYYDYVLADLNSSFDKVRPGGIIAGDDYTWRPEEGMPVKRAVTDFVAARGLMSKLEVLGSQFLIRR